MTWSFAAGKSIAALRLEAWLRSLRQALTAPGHAGEQDPSVAGRRHPGSTGSPLLLAT